MSCDVCTESDARSQANESQFDFVWNGLLRHHHEQCMLLSSAPVHAMLQ